MSKPDEQQISLDLGVPDDGKRKVTEEEPMRLEPANAQIHSLSKAWSDREKKESARHFREILKLARHF